MPRTMLISVTIDGKEHKIDIPQKDEEMYRRAARALNEAISVYKSSFRVEPEDYLTMAAMQLALDKVKLEMDRTWAEQVESLEEIGRKIDNYLNDPKE